MQITRPLIFFDLETTGVDVAADRIVELAVLKRYPDGTSRQSEMRFNPGVPIPKEATEVHHITNEDVANCPLFEEWALRLYHGFLNCDLAGFNAINFDIPLLWEEFFRSGINWVLDGVRVLDAGVIFKKKEPRTLEAAVRTYCGREHEGAHGALADVLATADVFDAQMVRYSDISGDVDSAAEFSKYDDMPRIDLAGKLVRDKAGNAIYNFGKDRGQRVRDNPGFAEWMLKRDFSQNTMLAVRKVLAEIR